MANKYPSANGNYSTAANWNGGTLPSSGDIVYANGKTIALDIDVNIGTGKLSTEVCPDTGIGGGGFTFSVNRSIIGNIKAGSTKCVYYITNGGTVVTVVGDITGGSSAGAYGVQLRSTGTGGTGQLNLTGNITGGDASTAYGVTASYAATDQSNNVTISGNATGGTAPAIYLDYGSTVNITGNQDANIAEAIICRNLIMNGTANASATANAALQNDKTGTATVTGILNNVSSKMAICFTNIYLNNTTPVAWKFYDSDDNEKSLYSADTLENQPNESDVREGIVYGIGDAYEGTCAVPPKASVALNVPVDDTVGELVVGGATPAEFVAALEASDLGQRMAKCAITEEVLTMLENL